MPHEPIRTTVIGSYPLPGWLELFAAHADETGPDDREEAVRDAVTAVGLDAAAIAAAIGYAVDQPAGVDVNEIIVRPTASVLG